MPIKIVVSRKNVWRMRDAEMYFKYKDSQGCDNADGLVLCG